MENGGQRADDRGQKTEDRGRLGPRSLIGVEDKLRENDNQFWSEIL